MIKIDKTCDFINEKMRPKEKSEKAKKFALRVALIGAIGVTFCALMAAKKGMEIRNMCKSKALDTVEKTKDNIQDKAAAVHVAADHAAKAASKAINNIDNDSNELRENIEEVYHDVKKGVDEKAEDLSKDIKDGYIHVKNAVDKAAEKVSSDLKKDEQ